MPEVKSFPQPTDPALPLIQSRHRSSSTREQHTFRRPSNPITPDRLRSNSTSIVDRDILTQLHQDLDRVLHENTSLTQQIEEEELKNGAELTKLHLELDALRIKRKE